MNNMLYKTDFRHYCPENETCKANAIIYPATKEVEQEIISQIKNADKKSVGIFEILIEQDDTIPSGFNVLHVQLFDLDNDLECDYCLTKYDYGDLQLPMNPKTKKYINDCFNDMKTPCEHLYEDEER